MDARDRGGNQPRDDAPSGSRPQATSAPNGGIRVLAAVIRRDDRYLVGRRAAHKRHGGLWEFPGGKLLAGESWFEAARRELAEELDVAAIAAWEPLLHVRDPGSDFIIAFVRIDIRGEPLPIEHSALLWATHAELVRLDLAPADRAFVETLVHASSGD